MPLSQPQPQPHPHRTAAPALAASGRPLVVGLGEVLWDLLPQGAQLGGAPANFAYHAAALGAHAVVASAVGDDDRGRDLLARLSAAGLDVSYLAIDPAHPTGTVTVALDADGKPQYTIHEGVAWDHIPPSDALMALAAQVDAVCFGSLAQRMPVSRATIERFLDATRPGCLRVFDINLRQHYYSEAVVRASLARADVLKINDEELPVLAKILGLHNGDGNPDADPAPARSDCGAGVPPACGAGISPACGAGVSPACGAGVSPACGAAISPAGVGPDADPAPAPGDAGAPRASALGQAAQIREICALFRLRAVALTRGAHGCLLKIGNQEEVADEPGLPPDRIADTVGAGDAFTAALVMGLLAGRDAATIARHANRLASYVCSQPGAMPPVPETLR